MWMPSLIYEYEYPRTKKIRISYLLHKFCFGIFSILGGYIIITEFIMPVIEKGNRISYFELLFKTLMPLTVFMNLFFFIVWEIVLGFFAEITRFADREFFLDWWNSTTFEEYNRKWNKPVYSFLYRHVYLELIYTFKKSKRFS